MHTWIILKPVCSLCISGVRFLDFLPSHLILFGVISPVHMLNSLLSIQSSDDLADGILFHIIYTLVPIGGFSLLKGR